MRLPCELTVLISRNKQTLVHDLLGRIESFCGDDKYQVRRDHLCFPPTLGGGSEK